MPLAWLQALAAELRITVVRWDGLAVHRPGARCSARSACSSASGWRGSSACSARMRRPVETLGVGLASGCWCWRRGGRPSPRVDGARSRRSPSASRRDRTGGRPAVGDRAEGRRSMPSAADARTPSPTARRATCSWPSLGGGVFVVAVALLYGVDHGAEPARRRPASRVHGRGVLLDPGRGPGQDRDGDASTRRRASPTIAGLPTQTWYHWGEAWLGAAAITLFGTAPLDARHLIVLPLLLLAAAALTGTLVRRIDRIDVPRRSSSSASSPACSWRPCRSSRARTSARGPSA